jgi:hypothetical protein
VAIFNQRGQEKQFSKTGLWLSYYVSALLDLQKYHFGEKSVIGEFIANARQQIQ